MPIRQDRSDLPPAGRAERRDGSPPDVDPVFARVLGLEWLARDRAEGPLPHAVEGSRARNSDAGACARAVAFAAMGAPRLQLDEAGLFVANQGKWLHGQWQRAMVRVHGERFTAVEVTAQGVVGKGGAIVSGHGDFRLDIPCTEHDDRDRSCSGCRRLAFEVKSLDGLGFKYAIGVPPAYWPRGPKLGHVAQGSLLAHMDDADELVVIYLARGAVSHQLAAKRGLKEWERYCAQWTYGREAFEALAAAELDRMGRIVDLVDAGELPARKPAAYPDDVLAMFDVEPEIPRAAVITQPADGSWLVRDRSGDVVQTSGNKGWWECMYCGYQPICPSTSSGRDSITTDLVERIGLPDYPVPEPRPLDEHTGERVLAVLAGDPDPGPTDDEQESPA